MPPARPAQGGPSVSPAGIEEPRADPAVLTLDEAARLLRVRDADLADMARRRQVPARHIGTQWRFSRQALVDWLAAKESIPPRTSGSTTPVRPPESRQAAGAETDPRSAGSSLSAIDLSSTKARGADAQGRTPEPEGVARENGEGQPGDQSGDAARPEAAGADTSPQSAPEGAAQAGPGDATQKKAVESVGERPQQPTAGEVSLRAQGVLLNARQLQVELDQFYTRSEQQGLVFIASGPSLLPALAQGKQNLYTTILGARYGLTDQLEAVVASGFQRRTLTTTVGNQEESATSTDPTTLGLALRYAAVAEGKGYPSVVLSAEGALPTGEGSYGVGGGVAFIKSVDPAALFGNLRYRHTFSQEFSDLFRLEPENSVSATGGLTVALNDTLALSLAVSGLFTSQNTFANATLPSEQQFSLQLGVTSLLRERLYVEPTVTFALNGPTTVTLGLSLPYTFPW
jgi:excisionase family DNA binding protein